uniref:Uncharacterized protein n=1 Tax=Amphimedon queenslandica TaxID=400682 RepID=A0A1X7V294_AMPQE
MSAVPFYAVNTSTRSLESPKNRRQLLSTDQVEGKTRSSSFTTAGTVATSSPLARARTSSYGNYLHKDLKHTLDSFRQ